MEKHYTEIEKTMNSLDGIRQVEPNPFLITRIEARLAKKQKTVLSFSWQPALRMTLAAVLIAANILTMTRVLMNKETKSQPQVMSLFSEKVSDYQY
jgi:hypothetical protein